MSASGGDRPLPVGGQPPMDTPVPQAVAEIIAGRPAKPVWRNEIGGLTFEVLDADRRLFVKWNPVGAPADLRGEADRMDWARQFTTVPEVLSRGQDEHGSWLVTVGLPGQRAMSPRWKAEPVTAVTQIGRGLRAFHDALSVIDCPWIWDVPLRSAGLGREHLDRLGPTPDVEQLVVCHGDTCAPNFLIDDRGDWSGCVDLGSLGVADRWADLAVATYSTNWNYGPGFQRPLLEAYGIEPDDERTRFYRLLWDLT